MEIHVVQAGETLNALAARYGVSLARLVAVNQPPNPDQIVVGQALILPQEVHVTVRPGDTLFAIARAFGISLEALLAANPQIPDPNRIVPGQEVRIPGIERERYTVRPGDTFFAIARARGIPLAGLVRMNPQVSDPSRIFPGNVVWVPVPERARPVFTVNAYVAPGPGAPNRVREVAPWLTSLSLFSFPVTAQGAVQRPGYVAVTVEAARQANVLPLAVITNFAGGTFDLDLAHAVLSNPDARARVVADTGEILDTFSLTGVNVDFENMLPEDRPLFNAFMRELAEGLRPRGYLVGLNVAPKMSDLPNAPWVGTFDYATLGQVADFVMDMTYEWGWVGGPPMAVAPANLVRRALEYAVSLIPRGKLLQGIPLYGYDWQLDQLPETLARPVAPPAAVTLAFERGVAIRYEPLAASPWFIYTDAEGRQRELWFEDPRSILAKLEVTQDLGLAGVSFWNLAYRFPQNWQVLQRVARIRKGRLLP